MKRSIGATLATFAALGLALPVGAGASTPVFPKAGSVRAASPFELAPNTMSEAWQDAFEPQVATAPSGTSTVVWRWYSGATWMIQAARVNASGYAGPVMNVTLSSRDPDRSGAYEPQVASAPDGKFTIAWKYRNSERDSAYIAQAARIDARGNKGRTLDLSAPGQDAYDVRVATAPNGTSTVVWRRYNGTNANIIQAVRIDARGNKGRVLDLSAPGQGGGNPRVAAGPDGSSTVTWQRSNGTKVVIQAVRIDARGNKGRVLDLSATDQNAYDPQVATAPNGTSTITWSRSNGTNTIVQAVRIDSRGNKSRVLDLSASGGDANYPQVAAAPNGTTTVIWRRYDGTRYIAQAIRIDSRGNKSRALNLSAPGQDAYEPQVATAPNGTSTVTWRRYNGTNNTIQAVRINPSGWLSPTANLSAPGENAAGPQVATARNGSSTITWSRPDGNKSVIQAARLP